MFDIGFSEILVIAIVALIVIGPERLPKVARTLGHLFGRMQRYVNDVKADISREMELEELRKLQATMQDTARSIEQSVNKEIRTTHSALNGLAAQVTDLASSQPLSAAEPAPVSRSAEQPASSDAVPAAQLELGLDTPDASKGKQS